ncbi:MAG: hypothetical protein QOJ38_1953 [Solirubrobacterales bacterium]|nr:hypothetical protein [Solirubrobacterales bacterium]
MTLLVGWRASHGSFPFKFGNVEYEAKDAAAEAGRVAWSQEQRIRYLEVLARLRPESEFEDIDDEA